MGYLVVAFALFCLTVKGFCGKKVSTYAMNTRDVLFFNLLRTAFCVLISLALLFFAHTGGFVIPERGMLLIALISGVANAAFLVGWMLAVQKNTMVAVDVTLTLGSLLPAVLCFFLFSEPLSYTKMLGFLLVLSASLLLSNGRSKKKLSGSGIAFLVFATLGDGMVGFSQQLFRQYYTENGKMTHGVYYADSVFHFYTYLFAAILLFLVWLSFRLRVGKGISQERRHSYQKALPYISVMAVCLFLANDMQLRAGADYGISAQVLYPVIRGGCLITANITALFFEERFTKRTALGMAVALGGILLMNLL